MSTSSSPTSKTIKMHLLEASVKFTRQPFIRPLILSSGAIETITQADAQVRVEIAGVEAVGNGCIYLSDLWAWPEPAYSHEQRDAAMRRYCEQLAMDLPRILSEASHPLVAGLQLHEHVLGDEASHGQSMHPPALARSVCASIFDAAMHDAVGRLLGVNAFDLYAQPFDVPQTDALFEQAQGTSRAIVNLLSQPPQTHSPAWWVVGKSDDLESDVRPMVETQGYFAFKVKTLGQDAYEDAHRVVALFEATQRWGLAGPRISVDSNEGNPDAASVLAFLDALKTLNMDAYDALELIEQPTGRDIREYAFDWHETAKYKTVVLDEGLISTETMPFSKSQGWSGFALKTCKGHSFMLVAAAWAHQHGMVLSMQDLTNPGLAAVHAALFAARVPTVNGVELNSLQFTPHANDDWFDRYPGLFRVADGYHQLPSPNTIGLGGCDV